MPSVLITIIAVIIGPSSGASNVILITHGIAALFFFFCTKLDSNFKRTRAVPWNKREILKRNKQLSPPRPRRWTMERRLHANRPSFFFFKWSHTDYLASLCTLFIYLSIFFGSKKLWPILVSAPRVMAFSACVCVRDLFNCAQPDKEARFKLLWHALMDKNLFNSFKRKIFQV